MASIDIVIPCYNYAHFLPQCVDSALSQGIEDVRVIIIDNASTDNSVAVANDLAAKDSRIEVVSHGTNQGPHASFNEGIDLARADYFLILCADDLLTPGSLRYGLELLEKVPQVAFVLGAQIESWAGEALPEHLRQSGAANAIDGNDFIGRCCRSIGQDVAAHAILVRASVQKAVGHYRASLPFYDDLEMVLRLAREGMVAQLHAPIAIPRIHSANISESLWQNKLRVLREREAVFESFFGREGATMKGAARLRRMSMHRIGAAAYWSAVSHMFRGRTAQGAELLRYAFSLDPVSRLVPPLGHLYRTRGILKRAIAIVAHRMPRLTSRLEDHP